MIPLRPLILVLALAGCTTTQEAPLSYAGAFKPMPYPEAVFASPLAAASALVGNFPESREGGPQLNMEIVSDPDGKADFLIRATARGYLDDSVAGEQWLARLRRQGEGWAFADAGNRWTCQRGAQPGSWVITPCP